MNLLPLDVPPVLPDVPVAAGSFVEACACSTQPVTVICSFFGDSGGRDAGGDCGGRGGSPGTRGGCVCIARATNIIGWVCEADCAAAMNTQLKTVIVQILIPIPHPPIQGISNPRTIATSAPNWT